MKMRIGHAASVHNRFTIGEDGKTPYHRMHGLKASERAVEFGERVMFFIPKKKEREAN